MKLGNTSNCRFCGNAIMICRIRGGKWTAFNIALVPAAEATTDTYVPVRTDTGIVSLVPVDELSERRLTGIRWYALKHRCSGWIRHRDAQRDTMTTLDEAIQQFFDTFTGSSDRPERLVVATLSGRVLLQVVCVVLLD